MKHIILHKIGKSEADIENESAGGSSHVYFIKTVGIYLRQNLQHDRVQDSTLFLKSINDLKKLRVKADYDEVEIDYDLSKESISLSDKSNKILKKVL